METGTLETLVLIENMCGEVVGHGQAVGQVLSPSDRVLRLEQGHTACCLHTRAVQSERMLWGSWLSRLNPASDIR